MEEYKILKEYEEAKQNGTLPEMAEELDAKCRDLIDEAFGNDRHRAGLKRIGTVVVKAAMVVLILFGLSSVTVLSIDAFRVPVLNYLVGRNGKYTSISSGEIVYAEQNTLKNVIQRVNSVIPEGYEQISSISMDAQYSVVYQNANNHVIYFTYTKESCTLNIDAEDASCTSLNFGDFPAVFSETNGCKLIWEDTQSNATCTLFADGMEEGAFWEFAYLLIS